MVGKTTFLENTCKGCGLCVDACPKQIIELRRDKINAKGYHPAGIIPGKEGDCIGCAFCATMCPDCVITVEKE